MQPEYQIIQDPIPSPKLIHTTTWLRVHAYEFVKQLPALNVEVCVKIGDSLEFCTLQLMDDQPMWVDRYGQVYSLGESEFWAEECFPK